ncbi:MAG: galactokinase [Bdellovibrionota bacterium]
MIKEVSAEAKGRVNLIGEHTDYNGGWVLPTAIPQGTKVNLSARDDMEVHATTGMSFSKAESALKYTIGKESPTKSWIDYIQGATKILLAAGHPVRGFNIHVESTVPVGSGLSSSAALEVSLLKALREMFSLKLTEIEIAKIGQQIENEFVGAKVGIMDQMACALANFGEALFLDTKKMEFERIRIPTEKMDLVVINSGVEHQHAGGDYNQRRSECEQACEKLFIRELREFGIEDLPKLKELPDKLMRRARHVITENERVHQAVAAIRSGDMDKLGQLFYESHASMRDDYEVSIAPIDLLVELCRQQPASYGARLTGGGFGGSIVAITHKGKGSEVANAVAQAYFEKSKVKATILVPAPQ